MKPQAVSNWGPGVEIWEPTRIGFERPSSDAADGTKRALREITFPCEATGNASGATRETLILAAWSLSLSEYGTMSSESEIRFHTPKGGLVVPFHAATSIAEYLHRTECATSHPVDTPPAGTMIAIGDEWPHPFGGLRLQILVPPQSDTADIRARFDRDSLSDSEVNRVLAHFGRLLGKLVEVDPGTPVGGLSGLSAAERTLALRDELETESVRLAISVHARIDERAAHRPDAVAVVGDGKRLTYAELVNGAEVVAARLHDAGVRHGDLVPLFADNDPLAVVAILGILKAGAAYVPIERSWPRGRTSSLLATLSAGVAVASPRRAEQLFAADDPLALADVLWLTDDGTPPTPALDKAASRAGVRILTEDGTFVSTLTPAPAAPEDLAYVLFTSGSTGIPKGVQVPHGAVVNLVDWVNETFDVSPSDQTLLVTPLAFDLSVYSIFGPLFAGASVRIPNEADAGEPARLLDILETEPVTLWNSAPAALSQLEPYLPGNPLGRAALRLVLLSGDWIPVGLPHTVRAVFPGTEVVALGGPTETTVWSNYFRFDHVDPSWTSIPYGRPIHNVSRYVLDAALRPVPPGIPGDLYIAGACLAWGYFGAAGQTATRFVADPFGEPGTRMYQTGDRVRLRPDGTMEFLGRADHQVKIRGFRVELGEVDTALVALPSVRKAVVHAHKDGTTAELVGYVVPASEDVTSAAIRSALALELPAYAVPSTIILLDRIPLTANGKVDRGALPASSSRRQYDESTLTAAELAIAAVWTETLGIKGIRGDDNFFDLGGHSLAATRVIARLRTTLGVRIPLRALITEPTLSSFAKVVETVAGKAKTQ